VASYSAREEEEPDQQEGFTRRDLQDPPPVWPDEYFIYDRREQDELLPHVRGTAYWREDSLGAGYWVRYFNGRRGAVEFDQEENRWFPLFFIDGNTYTSEHLALTREQEQAIGLGHLRPEDPRIELESATETTESFQSPPSEPEPPTLLGIVGEPIPPEEQSPITLLVPSHPIEQPPAALHPLPSIMANIGPQQQQAAQQAAPAAAPAPAQGNGGKPTGNPPTLFTGDRTKAKTFVREFNIYAGLNEGTDIMSNPLRKTLLALSYIRGEKVDDWVDVIHNWIAEQSAPDDPNTNHVQLPSTSNNYWLHYTTKFNQAFADSAEKQNAIALLKNLRMEGRDLDSYLAKFRTYAAKAGYGLSEEGTLDTLRAGLPDELGKEIIKRHNPQTWDDWVAAAHTEHDVWLRLKMLYPSWKSSKDSRTRFGKPEGVWRRSFNMKPKPPIPQHQNQHRNNAVVPMDVDRIGRTLTEDEKQQLLREGKCFRCTGKGHISKNCPTKGSTSAPSNKTNRSQSSQGPPAYIRTTEEEETKQEKEAKIGVDQVIDSINTMSAEEKEEFLEKAFAQKGF
jgi:hypothetical protein